jgi:rhamnogalacturonyl hydrolase YesR
MLSAKIHHYQQALAEVLAYSKVQGYAGYSKFDAMNSPYLKAIALGIPALQWAMTQAVYRFPMNIRPFLGVKKGINPKAMGLLALGYLLASEFDKSHREDYLAEGKQLLQWLLDNRAEGYSGMSCGYNYIWPNLRFTAPENFPNLVVTGNVIIAFLTAYEMLGDELYLQTARSSVDFILNELNLLIDNKYERAISYVPNSNWIVINNQGLAAVIMAWVGKHTGEPDLLEKAKRHIQFVVNQKTDYGAWYYAYPPESSPVIHDNYHTGNVLDWILFYSLHSGDKSYLEVYEEGLNFYREHLFLPDGTPKHRHNVILPHDIHSSAQGAITFSRAALHFKADYAQDAERVLDWALANMRANDGGFYYMKGRFGINKSRLLHWNEGLMSVALGHILKLCQEPGEGT